MRNIFEQMKLIVRAVQIGTWQCNRNSIMISRNYFDSFFLQIFLFVTMTQKGKTLKFLGLFLFVYHMLRASLNQEQESHAVF